MTFALNPQVENLPVNPLRRIFEQAGPDVTTTSVTNFASGHPHPVYCDHEGLRRATEQAVQDHQPWRYGPSGGDPDLLAALAPLCAKAADTAVMVTSGAQQGIFLACQALGRAGQTLLVPDPVYPAILSVATLLGLNLRAYRASSAQAALEDLPRILAEDRAYCALYVLPTFANPTGDTWNEAERDQLLEICAQAKLPIVEDDPYRDLWFQAPPPARLLFRASQLDLDVTVLSLGSLSKIVAPGLRIGWVQGPKPLLQAMTAARQASDLQPNALAQRVACHYIDAGRLEPHLCGLRRAYSAAFRTFATSLAEAGFTGMEVSGGMFVMPTLPAATRTEGLIDHLTQQGLLVAPGAAFALQTPSRSRQMRLCFAALAPADMATAGRTLAQTVAAWT